MVRSVLLLSAFVLLGSSSCFGAIVPGEFFFSIPSGSTAPANVLSFSDADCSFDVELSISAAVGTVAYLSDAVGINSANGMDGDLDGTGEDLTFNIAITNIQSLSSNNVTLSGLTFTEARVESASGNDDSGTFVIAGNNYTWQDSTAAPTAGPWELENDQFDLLTASSGTNFTSLQLLWEGGDGYRLNKLSFQLDKTVTAVPEPSPVLSLGLIAVAVGAVRYRRRLLD